MHTEGIVARALGPSLPSMFPDFSVEPVRAPQIVCRSFS